MMPISTTAATIGSVKRWDNYSIGARPNLKRGVHRDGAEFTGCATTRWGLNALWIVNLR